MRKIMVALLVAGVVVCVYAAVSWEDEFFVAEPIENYSVWQDQILDEYETSEEESIKARNAYLLSQLWRKGLLREEIKDFLVEKYYKVVLLQVYGDYQAPNLVVQCQQTFPFPSNRMRFTPTLYKNREVEWAPEKPQKEHAMSQNSSIITSRIGGELENGDVIFYKIKIDERRDKKVVWEKVIATNEVVLQGLKEKYDAAEKVDSWEDLSE